MNGTELAGRFRRVLEGAMGIPATDGNRIELLRNGREAFPAMLEAIADADRTVDLLTFAWWTGAITDRFADALARRAEAGCRVRVLVDSFGAGPMDDDAAQRMADAGVDLARFRPRLQPRIWEGGHRTHRRVLLCDETIGFTGGVGIAEEWEGDGRGPGEWRDTHVRVRGPAVDGLRGAFLDNWAAVRFDIIDERDRFPAQDPAGDSAVQVVRGGAEVGWSDVATLVRVLLAVAHDRVRISTPYLAPDDDTLAALCATARRGVAVEVVTAGARVDKRLGQLAGEANYGDMLEAGVRIWRYQPSMFHAKSMTVDGALGCVGTVNFDSRSFGMDEEVELVVFDPAVAAELDADFERDRGRSQEVELADWRERSAVQRAGEAIADVAQDHI